MFCIVLEEELKTVMRLLGAGNVSELGVKHVGVLIHSSLVTIQAD